MAFDPVYLPRLLAGISMLALAGLLLYVAAGRRPNQALALPLGLHGVMSIVTAFADASQDPARTAFLEHMIPFVLLPLAPSFLYFASIYPRRRSFVRTGPVGSLVFACLIAVWPLAYLVNPSWYWGSGGAEALFAGGPGPLRWGARLFLATYGLIAFVYLREYLMDRGGSPKADLLLLSLSFALIHLHNALHRAGALIRDWTTTGFPGVGETGAVVANVGSFLPVFGLLALLALQGRLRRDPGLPRFTGAIALATVSGIAAAAVHVIGPGLGGSVHTVLGGLWDLAFPLLLAYAILRHQLLGIEVKVRWGISKTTLAGIFIAVFFIVSEAAQEFFGATLGSSYVGILAAGMLVFAIAPLSRFADRVAERAVPVTAPEAAGETAGATERETRYRDVLQRFLVDARLTREEERTLAHLAADLGIDAGRAFELRAQVEEDRGGGSSP